MQVSMEFSPRQRLQQIKDGNILTLLPSVMCCFLLPFNVSGLDNCFNQQNMQNSHFPCPGLKSLICSWNLQSLCGKFCYLVERTWRHIDTTQKKSWSQFSRPLLHHCHDASHVSKGILDSLFKSSHLQNITHEPSQNHAEQNWPAELFILLNHKIMRCNKIVADFIC